MLSATTPLVFTLVLAGSLMVLAYSLYRRFLPLRKAVFVDLFNHGWERTKSVIVYVIFQKRMMNDPYAGFYHILIFWGFLVLGFRSASLILEGLGFHCPLALNPGYLFMKDLFEVLVLVGILLSIFRRFFFKPERLKNSLDAWVTLGLIASLMIADLVADGSQILAASPGWAAYAPFSSMTASFLPAANPQQTYVLAWWVHIGILLFFANYLPYSKHFHVYTSFFNVFFRKLEPAGKLNDMDLENIDEDSTFGARTYGDLNWRQLLDFYTCTECGRCRELCPTRLTDKPLSPMEFGTGIRDYLYHVTGNLTAAETQGTQKEEPVMTGEVIDTDTIWSCTTCRWCEEACPLFITYTDKIVEMRRHLVLEESSFPAEAQNTFRGMEVNGNPWNLPADTRADWCGDLDIPLLKDNPDAEFLFWVGCAGAFDDRAQKTSRNLVKLLRAAEVSFAILGTEETCTGDSARRLGNEYLFQMLAQQNVEKLNGYGVKKIVTNCPHCLNTLLHEYPEFGGRFQVYHSTELIADLISRGRIFFRKPVERQVTYHDPCYLARTNKISHVPRYILDHIPGIERVEMEQSGDRSICCGAGGGRMWLEENLGTRINHLRLKDVEDTGTGNVSVACPFCYSMLSDAAKETEKEIRTYDIIDLAAEALE